jgi:hypothetical protein
MFWSVVEFYVFFQTAWFGFFLFFVIDTITSLTAYIVYYFDIITSSFIVKGFLFYFLSFFGKFFSSEYFVFFFDKFSKYSIIMQFIDFFNYSNFGIFIRWVFFYSFFDFFNLNVISTFIITIVYSLGSLPFYLSIIYSVESFFDFFSFFWDFFFFFFKKIASYWYTDIGSAFYWYLYFWLKIKYFFDDFCINYKIKGFRISHFDLRYVTFALHSHEFDFRTRDYNFNSSFFNLLSKSDRGFVYNITQYLYVPSYININLKASRPPIVAMRHIIFSGWKYYYFLCFLMCFLFSSIIPLFFIKNLTSGNVNFFWRRFLDLREEEIKYTYNLSDKVQNKMQDIHKVLGTGGTRTEPWMFWLFPTFLSSYKSGELDFNNSMRKMIKEETNILNRIRYRLGLKRWNEFLNSSSGIEDYHRRLVFYWEWFLDRRNDKHFIHRNEFFMKRKNISHMNVGLLALGMKHFEGDMLRHYKKKRYDFSGYHLDPRFKDYYKAIQIEYPKIAYFMAHSYKRQKFLRKLMQNDEYLERIPKDMNVIAREKAEYMDIIFEYFYQLDKTLFNFKLPHWAYHKDMDNLMLAYAHSKKTSYKTENREIKVGETFWDSEAEVNVLESCFIWFFWAPLWIFMIITNKTGIPWYDLWFIYEFRLSINNIFLSIDNWFLVFFEWNNFSVFHSISIENPNSPKFREAWVHGDFDLFQRKSTMYFTWVKSFTLWHFNKDSMFLWSIYYFIYTHYPTIDFINCYAYYRYFFYTFFFFLTIIIYKNISTRKKMIFRTGKFRKLAFLHLGRLEAYRRLKVNLRKGFLWFWR